MTVEDEDSSITHCSHDWSPSLSDWLYYVQGYKSSIDGVWRHYENFGIVIVGAMVALAAIIWAYGYDVLFLFLVMSGIPLAAFLYFLLKRRKSALFWLVEAALLVGGVLPPVLVALGIQVGEDAPSDAGLVYWGAYVCMVFLGALFIHLRLTVVRLTWMSHGLDMLTQAIMYGFVRDAETAKTRFMGMVGPFSNALKRGAIWYARFRISMDKLPAVGLNDDLLHQWIVQTGGTGNIQNWLRQRHDRDVKKEDTSKGGREDV